MKKTLFALAVMAATTVPAFANSVDVKVRGTITPDACTPTLANGGVFDYGVIKANTLFTDQFTVLGEKSQKLNVTCSAPTKLALKVTSSRPDTDKPAGFPVNYLAFAAVNDMKVGGYALMISSPIVDGAVAKLIAKIDNGVYGPLEDQTEMYTSSVTNRLIAFNSGSASTPQALTTLSADINVYAQINEASALDLSNEIKIDGLATIELVYL
ncbi:DUF1120 domain-containing protein [Enterobacter cloacae]|uniref:DUF1120 domain-containing protein n=1 Tax=Enterobacter cloacae TaxID=550 RepID=UPI002003DFAE|nr:DUF1120 domain-containing protein [Enterobacter cloacae]MCK7177119.1 DUF1120 domain-containing protein [Enterobacter cloacae]